MPEPEPITTKRTSRRRGREKKQQSENNDDRPTGSNSQQDKASKPDLKSKKKSGRRTRRTERHFGIFHCKKCNSRWESAHVYVKAGTEKVLWRQRCKRCTDDDAWVFPYYHEPITCRDCLKRPCACTCEDCGKLIRKPPRKRDPDVPQDSIQSLDEYCKCKKRKQALGGLNDPKKPHIRELCERCRKGLLCGIVQENAEYEAEIENEP